MGESHRLQNLGERGRGAVYIDQDGEDIVAGGAPLLDSDVEVNGEGGVLNCWRDEEGGVSISHSNNSRE